MTTPERERLAQLMDDRRTELRLRWDDVALAGGISVKVLHDVRGGTSKPRRSTLQGIDAGLRWTPGSAERILAGGDPGPITDGPPSPGDALIARRARTPRWADRAVFCRDTGLSWELATRAETGDWDSLTPAERAAVEQAYPDEDLAAEVASLRSELAAFKAVFLDQMARLQPVPPPANSSSDGQREAG